MGVKRQWEKGTIIDGIDDTIVRLHFKRVNGAGMENGVLYQDGLLKGIIDGVTFCSFKFLQYILYLCWRQRLDYIGPHPESWSRIARIM